MNVKYKLDALFTPQQLAAKAPLQHGKSRAVTWPGGDLVVAIAGSFAAADGVSSTVQLHYRPRRGDGLLDAPRIEKSFGAPGEHRFNLPPGEFSFITHGPDKAQWSIDVQASPAPLAAAKVATLEQRVAALEQSGRAPLEVTPPALVQ